MPSTQKKRGFLSITYPPFEVLGKPDDSNKQYRNPRCVYKRTRTYQFKVRTGMIYTHEHLLLPCFQNHLIEIS